MNTHNMFLWRNKKNMWIFLSGAMGHFNLKVLIFLELDVILSSVYQIFRGDSLLPQGKGKNNPITNYVRNNMTSNVNIRSHVVHHIKCNRIIFSKYIATDKRGYPHNIFLISRRIHKLWYSLEAPCRGTSNEYPQHMFLLRNKKDISIFRMKKVPYLLLCIYPEEGILQHVYIRSHVVHHIKCYRFSPFMGLPLCYSVAW